MARIELSFIEAVRVKHLIESSNKENQAFLDNETHMKDMDELNPNLRKNMEYAIAVNNGILKQLLEELPSLK